MLIPKHERRFAGFDGNIVDMYAQGITLREIQAFLAEHDGTEVSQEFIISVTDAEVSEVTAWQSRPQQGDLSNTGRAAGWHVGHPRVMNREQRGSQALNKGRQ